MHLEYAHKCAFFYKVHSLTPWPFQKSRGLHSVLGLSTLTCCIRRFGRRLRSCHWNWSSFTCKMDCLIHQYYWRSSLLLSGWFLPLLLSGGVPLGLSYLFFIPWAKGTPKFSEGLIRDCGRCPVKYSPCLILSSSCDKDGISCLSFLLYYGLSWVAVFTLIVQRRRELNRDNRRMLVVLLFGVLLPT